MVEDNCTSYSDVSVGEVSGDISDEDKKFEFFFRDEIKKIIENQKKEKEWCKVKGEIKSRILEKINPTKKVGIKS